MCIIEYLYQKKRSAIFGFERGIFRVGYLERFERSGAVQLFEFGFFFQVINFNQNGSSVYNYIPSIFGINVFHGIPAISIR